ncbi:hypothetical protein C8Q78DRAFT_482108 [Trametes maxima]|nr:hypothetical protein C8Q78DRAFT_482108 [Trametes maxima]
MATSNVTIDDSSSLFLYEPRDAWTSSSGDDAQAYMNSTFHGTSVSGATCKFKFNGTGIWLYGAKKPDYGSFTLVVDDTVTTYDNATASDPTFGQLLGGVSNLKMGEHVATLMNGGTGPIDFDSLVFETVDPQQPYVAGGFIL